VAAGPDREHIVGKRKKPEGLAGWFGQVVAWLVILSVAAMVTVGVLIPRLGGATPYTILTGSMRPQLPPGTLVVVKPASADEIGIGDVITYQLESGKPAVVTHRVVSTSFNGKGEHIFRTQGDANNVADAKPVLEVQIKGKVWYSVPYLGHVNNAITGKERSLTMIIVVSGLLLYSAYMFTGALRDRVDRRRENVGSPS
jgi:signal peptidase